VSRHIKSFQEVSGGVFPTHRARDFLRGRAAPGIILGQLKTFHYSVILSESGLWRSSDLFWRMV
jgi:hypothetical protein